jgi:hypothetical protein
VAVSAWYDAGTVAVTNASATVTGTATNWVGPGVQAGYAFVGPAGDVYEIVDVVSDTQLTIAPAYRGSTASGQTYQIAPTRGVLQTLIDRTNTVLDLAQEASEFRVPDGTATDPGLRFDLDLDTGLYRPAANEIGMTTGGALRLLLSSTALTPSVPILAPNGSEALPSYAFSSDPDTGMFWQGSNSIGFVTDAVLRARIDAPGRFIVGPGPSVNIGGIGTLQINGTNARLGFHRYTNGNTGPVLALSHSRATTIGDITTVNNSDNISQIVFYGAMDTGAYGVGADVLITMAAAPSGGDCPAHMRLRTTAVGASTPTERVRITAAGNVGVGTTTPSVALHVVGAVRHSTFTVATLPAAGTAGAGTRAMVTDANATTFHSIVAGGGSNVVPVFSDGTNWRIG